MTGTPFPFHALEPDLLGAFPAVDATALIHVLDPLPEEHASCAPGERAAAVLALLKPGPQGPELLLVRRALDMEEHAGQIALPGGRVDGEDATPGATALREAWEETGLPPGQVQLLGALNMLVVPVSRHRVVPVVGWLKGEVELHARTAETAELWYTPLRDLRQVARPVELRGFPAWEFPLPGARVWGMTALVLGDLLGRLGLLPMRNAVEASAGFGPTTDR